MRMALVICPGNHWMFIVVLRPDEKCCCATFLPDFVPCAPCSGALTALRHRGRLSAAPVAVQADLPQGTPLHPVFSVLRPDEKCCFATFLPDFVPCAPCSGALTAPRHRGRLSAAPVAVQAGSAAGGYPAPRFFVAPARRKMLLCNIFAGLRSLCSVLGRTHRTASQRALVRRACRRASGIYRRGHPCTPF